MKVEKGFLFIIGIIVIAYICNYNVFAHDSNLGITGDQGIYYDDCLKSDYVDEYNIGDGYYEKWYDLETGNFVIQNEVPISFNKTTMEHLDDDIQTIYYSFSSTPHPEMNVSWIYNNDPDSAEIIIESFENSMLKWNNVYYYKEYDYNKYKKIKLVNLVNYDNLIDKTGIIPNVIIYPTLSSISEENAAYAYVKQNESSETYSYSHPSGIKHTHYSQFYIFINIDLFYDNDYAYERNGAHEMGHVLGLFDIDKIESLGNPGLYHHNELLMGYNYGGPGQVNITYKDIAGVAITRGLHTNNDHKWLYDSSFDTENRHKLICSLCNCVKYVEDLNDYTYSDYLSCGHNPNNLPTTLDSKMIPVASYCNTDYYKCRYCRYVAPFTSRVTQNYYGYNIYNTTYHTLHNNVTNLEYDILEEHDYTVNVAPGIYKCSKCDHYSNNCLYDEIDLCCDMTSQNKTLDFDLNTGHFIKINNDCSKSYKLTSLSLDDTVVYVYNSNMVLTNTFDTNILQSGYYNNTFEIFLSKGTHYIKIEHVDSANQDDISFTYQPTYLENNVLNINGSINCLPLHLHNDGINDYYHKLIKINNNLDSGLYNIEINGVKNDNTNMVYNEGMIKIYSDIGRENLIYKYNINDNTYNYAINDNGENNMIVSLPYKGIYYIEVSSSTSNYTSLTLSINSLYVNSINLFNASENTTSTVYHKFIQGLGDNFEEIRILQSCYVRIDVTYGGLSVDDILFVLFKKEYNTLSQINECEFINRYSTTLSDLNYYGYCYRHLSPGIYYIGCFDNDSSGVIEVSIARLLTNYGSNVLIPDIETAELQGSQIGILEEYLDEEDKSYRSSIITLGFTRLIYIDPTLADEESRLDYYWYSSNENILKVTDYGTVWGVGVGTAKVMAVYKYDYSIAFVKEFTIVSDASVPNMVLYNTDSIDINEETEDGTFRLELEKYRCPYPLYSIYNWSAVINYGYDDFEVILDGYANVTINGLGNFTLSGTYYTSYGRTIVVSINISIYE